MREGLRHVGQMDEWSRMDSPIHRIDARVQILTAFLFLVAVLSHARYAVSALIPFALYPVALAALGRIPLWPLMRKMLAAAPFALAVGLFNPVLDRQTHATIAGLPVAGGWFSFASILLRFALTVGTVLCLVACTGMYRLCAGLEKMRVPRVFVLQLLFLYRYLFLVADEGERMVRGARLRSAGRRALRLRTYGALIGQLLIRSVSRAERVYRAMLARGFNGKILLMRQPQMRGADVLFLLAWSLFFGVARIWNLAGGVGFLLTGGRG